MRIAILAGAHTARIEGLLKNKSQFELYCNEDLSTGLKEVDYTEDVDLILLLDAAFIKEGRQLDISDVFTTLKKMANMNNSRQILLITKNEDLATAFEGMLLECSNARHYKVDKINSRVLLDCIFGRYESPKVEPSSESFMQPEPVKAPEPKPEPEPEPVINVKPEPEPIPEPEPAPTPKQKYPDPILGDEAEEEDHSVKKPVKPKKEKKPKEKPVKEPQENLKMESGLLGKSKLPGSLPKNKIIIVTGNPNSGITSTACNAAFLYAKSGYKTLIMDFDAYTKGVNMYFDTLDTAQASRTQGVGLYESLEDFEVFEDAIIGIDKNLRLLGVRSDVIPEKIESVLYDDLLASDLIQFAVLDHDVVIVHIPLDKLLNMPITIKASDHVIYCTECTINGISRIDVALNADNYGSSSRKRDIQILTKKIGFLLCNYTSNSVTFDNFQDTLLLVSEQENICRPIIGYIPHISKFDDFKTTKNLYTDKKATSNLVEVLQNIYRV